MILWTVFPVELVLNGFEAQTPSTYEEIEYNGVKLLVERISAVECRIVRIISTNPEDYLCPDFQPGITLSYRPMLETLS